MQKEPQSTQSTSQPGYDKGDVSSMTVARQLSGPLTALAGSAFVSGVVYGLLEYLQRSPIRQEHVAGTAAWGQQLVLALAAVVILSVGRWRHRRRFGPRSGRSGCSRRSEGMLRAELRVHSVSVAKPRSLAGCYSRFLLPRCSCSASGGQASR